MDCHALPDRFGIQSSKGTVQGQLSEDLDARRNFADCVG
jgi:hypothetical protein